LEPGELLEPKEKPPQLPLLCLFFYLEGMEGSGSREMHFIFFLIHVMNKIVFENKKESRARKILNSDFLSSLCVTKDRKHGLSVNEALGSFPGQNR
jgi:hypothetical protein